jgi:hypothetical protein
MVKNERTPRDVAALNQQILLLARDLAEHSPAKATILFGMNEQTVATLLAMDVGAIVRLSQVPVMIFAPRIPTEILDQVLTQLRLEE